MSKPTIRAHGNERWQNVGHAGDVCFVTTTIQGFRPALAPEPIARMFVDALQFYRSRGEMLLHAWVVMPEHVHLLVTPLRGSISDMMELLKRYTSRQILAWCKAHGREDDLHFFADRGRIDGERYSVWMRSFRSVPLQGDQAVLDKIAYIHGNPVRRGLAATPEEWPWSSAGAYSRPEAAAPEADLFEILITTRRDGR